jgi:DNA polymerase
MLSIDLETYCALDLKKVGVYRYAEEAEILLLCYAYDNGPIHCVDIANGNPIPPSLKDDILNDDIIKTAWNATFERILLSAHFGVKLTALSWDCTQLRAAYKGLSLKLGETAKILGTTLKIETRLINFFCKPDARGLRKFGVDHPEKWEEFIAYCKGDVESERSIRPLLEDVKVERNLWGVDGIINDRGILVDNVLIDNALILDAKRIENFRLEMTELSGINNPNSPVQLKKWLLDCGLETASVDKEHIEDLLSKSLPDDIRRVLELRQKASKTSSKKYDALKRAMCKDGRVRGLTQMCGATRTRRWAGRVVQVQNLYRNREPLLHEARDLVKNGHDPFFIFDDDILSQLIRCAFTSQDGDVLTVADFSAIEARVLAWLADEAWVNEVFKGDGKLYEATAAKMFGVEMENVTKELRAKGKVATLALGYNGALGALRKMNAEGTDEELRDLVNAWRAANPNICKLWADVNNIAFQIFTYGGSINYKCLRFYRDEKWFYIELPSKGKLCYWNPTISDDLELEYWGVYEGVWACQRTYGGKLVENIVQAIARDCLAVSLLRAHKAGMNIVMHVHDEIIVEGSYLKELIAEMEKTISWAPGLVLAADGFESKYYKK